MKYTIICTLDGTETCCAAGQCPTIYETDKGTYAVQGFVLSKEEKENLAVPQGEDIIEIPKSLIEKFLQKI